MTDWTTIARRIVIGLGVEPGELIEVQDDSGRSDLLMEVLLAIECAGATPLPRIASPDYLARLVAETPIGYLAAWDRHRREWLARVDRRLILGSVRPDFTSAPADAVAAWHGAVDRLTVIEEARRLPILVVGIPTEKRAQQSVLSFEALEELMLPALAATVEELQREIAGVLDRVQGCHDIMIRTNDQYELRLKHGDRRWLSDDGCIDANDRASGAIVSNLPAGSIYTTVLESASEGTLWLPKAGDATNVLLRFSRGRIAEIEADEGAEALRAMFDRHSGEPRRIGHIGIGLNPYLRQPIGWTLVDEHVHGYLFISFGENRYMGGENESSLNADFALPGATLVADGTMVVDRGKVVPG